MTKNWPKNSPLSAADTAAAIAKKDAAIAAEAAAL